MLIAISRPGQAETRTSTAGSPQPAVIEVTRNLNVYADPTTSPRIMRGVVARGARFRVYERTKAKGCKKGWLRIDQRAWICARSTRPTTKSPTSRPSPDQRGNAYLPYSYIVTSDAPAYKSLDEAVLGDEDDSEIIGGTGGFVRQRIAKRGDKRFYKTPRGWVASSDVKRVRPIGFKGVVLTNADRGKRLAFAVRQRARLYDVNGRRISKAGPLRRSYLGEIGEPILRRGMTLHSIGDGQFVRARDIGQIQWPESPDNVGQDERWLDVSLSQQILVAYEGKHPVLATLVSTGSIGHSTPRGVYQIEKKRTTGRLRSLPGSERQWDVHVPWVITLKGRIAMHPAYWHREFGRRYSAGCINLTPQDAKWVWDFAEPGLPAGWLRIHSDAESPGTTIRVRR